MLDTARHYLRVPTILQMIDAMSYNKVLLPLFLPYSQAVFFFKFKPNKAVSSRKNEIDKENEACIQS